MNIISLHGAELVKRYLVRLIGSVLVVFWPTGPIQANNTIDDIVVGFTTEGHPYKGNPDAPLVLIEYSDYLCPFCARHFNSTLPELVEKYVKPGQMKMEFRHFPIPKLHPTAAKGHQAAACAGEQGPVAFWQFHNALFTRQSEWNRLQDPDDFLSSLADDLELDMAAYDDCRQVGHQNAKVLASMALGNENNFRGTPTFQMIAAAKPEVQHTIVGARPAAYFSDYADALLAGKPPPKEPEKPKPELPAWAKPDALAADVQRPGFTVSGDPFRGDVNARLVIVEFTDYQCPACARHNANTQPPIDEQLIDSGKVRWVYKTLPLKEHANAAAAAVAAECAAEQNQFHDMHQALFEQQEDWSTEDPPDPALLKIAAPLELDLSSFADCLGSRQPLERVLRDMYDATGVTRSTPAFVILDGEGGQTINGRREPEQFISVVLKYLESVLANDAEKPKEGAQSEDNS